MLSGLDDVGWAGLTHAYGSAEDTPGLLRAATSEDSEAAAEALSELYGSIFHQGTVYPATVAAVPFLADLARHAARKRDEFVWMLGMMADSRHAYGKAFPQVSAAVAGQAPALVTLLDDDDATVREAAAYAAVQAGVTAEPLWRRWRIEHDPAARASLALALGRIDPAAGGPVLADAVVHGSPAVRVAAAAALVRAGLAWPDGAIPAVVDAIDDGAKITYCWTSGADWYEELVVAPDVHVAADMVTHMLQARNPKTRRAGIWAMSRRCEADRSAPPVFVPMTVPAIRDPDADVRRAAVDALRRCGVVAARYADTLADIATGFPMVAGERGFTTEYDALKTLVLLGDPRWIEPVCAAAATGHPPHHLLLSGARFNPSVFAQVRDRLGADPARADVLAKALAGWGADAAAAVPELLAAMPLAGAEVTWALLEIGHDDPAAVPQLRVRVAQMGDLQAAMAVRRITGDAEPLYDALAAVLSHGNRPWPTPVSFLSELGDALLPVMPAARDHLTGTAARTHPERERQILAARVVAAVDGPRSVLPTVRAVLVAGQTPARAAADLVTDLAVAYQPAVAYLEPDLRERLDDQWSRLAAARALSRLGVPTAELVEPLVRGIADYAGRFGLSTILELRAVEAIPGLDNLVTRNERFAVAAAADDLIWADELLQERTRSAIAALRTMGPPHHH